MSLEYGDPVIGVMCPRCHMHEVVYNGNYFCGNFSECGWAMKEEAGGKEGERDRQITLTYLQQRWEKANDTGDVKEIERMEFYLKQVEQESERYARRRAVGVRAYEARTARVPRPGRNT